MKRYTGIFMSLLLGGVMIFTAGCSSESEKKGESAVMSDSTVINENYEKALEDITNDSYQKLTESNPIVDEFTPTDFQFTSTEEVSDSSGVEKAFNVPKNGYAIMTPSGATYGYIGKATNEFDGSFKNAKGFGFESTKSQIIEAYKVDSSLVYVIDSSKSVFGFASVDGEQFASMTVEEVQNALFSKEVSANPVDSIGNYNTIAIIELSSDEDDNLTEYAIYHYSKDTEDASHNH